MTTRNSGIGTLLIVVLSIAGCSSVETKSFRMLGAPDEPATDPAKVEILQGATLRPHITLGRIEAVPQGNPDNEAIEEAVRKEAAKLGADAVIINYQGEAPRGFSISGLPGSAHAERETGRVIKATAIKFEAEHRGGLAPRLRERLRR